MGILNRSSLVFDIVAVLVFILIAFLCIYVVASAEVTVENPKYIISDKRFQLVWNLENVNLWQGGIHNTRIALVKDDCEGHLFYVFQSWTGATQVIPVLRPSTPASWEDGK